MFFTSPIFFFSSDKVLKIVQASSDLVHEYLTFDASLCYWALLLQEYSKLQFNSDTIQVHKNARIISRNRDTIQRNESEWIVSEFLFFALDLVLTLLVWRVCLSCGCCGRKNATKKVYTAVSKRDLDV